jgi:hypothetical protein
VTVVDVTPTLVVDSPTLGSTLERRRIEQLPINGRNLTTLLQTIPGLEGTRAFGAHFGSFELSLDGSPLADRQGWSSIGYRQPSLESVQEFKVETNSSSAKFNRPTSIVVTTKSGTNDLHGSAFETNRNNAVGLARSRTDYYDSPPPLNRNEFGVSAGAPVFLPKVYNGKNRTFWFFAWERLTQERSTTRGFSVPTEAMRNGDMTGLVDSSGRQFLLYDPQTTDPVTWSRERLSYNGRLNVLDPNRISPLAKKLLAVTPLPTLPDVNPNVANNWFGPVARPVRSWTSSTRIDHSFGDNDRVYGRYTQADYSDKSQTYSIPTLDASNFPAGTQNSLAPNKSLAISWVRTISPTFFNDLSVSGSREKLYVGTGDPGRHYANELGLPNPFYGVGWPFLSSAGLRNLNYQGEYANGFNSFYSILDNNATKIIGRHELQFGFHFRYDQYNVLPFQQAAGGAHDWGTLATALYDPSTSRTNPRPLPLTGNNFANFLLGSMNYGARSVHGYFYARAKEYALYIQDNFKLSPRLTLNLGLRWDRWPPVTEKHNMFTGFDRPSHSIVLQTELSKIYELGMAVPSVVARFQELGVKFVTYDQVGQPRSLMTTPKTDFGPRLGFAYRAGDGAKSFVLRGGYRMSYFQVPLDGWVQRQRKNAPFDAQFFASQTRAAYTPDGIANYGLRSTQTIVAGANSTDAISTDVVKSLFPGSANASYFAPHLPTARIQDWNLTLEKEILPNVVARAAYIGNHSSNLEQIYNYNEPTPEYVWYKTTGEELPGGPLADVATNFYDRVVFDRVEEFRHQGYGNSNGFQLELERRSEKGYAFQLSYVMMNTIMLGGQGYGQRIGEVNQFLPGEVPTDLDARNKLLNYQRDTSIPKHRLRWNWIVDLPFGKGKPIAGNAGGLLDRLIGGWQIAGLGSLWSTYFALPDWMFPTGAPIEMYGYKYPIQDCTSGECYPGYLWWNGYIPAHQINSVDENGKPNGIMGVPADYKPAVTPLIPWGSTTLPPNAPANTNIEDFWDSNTVWVPLKDGSVARTEWTGLFPLRNQYRPSSRQWGLDASVFKNIPINERVRVRLNVDFFNVLNHPGNPSDVASTGILSTQYSGVSPRELQISLRILW